MSEKIVKQLSIFLENKSGRLANALSKIAEKGINISALSLAETTDFGILRLIVNEPEKALELIKEMKMAVKLTSVFAVKMDTAPGGVASVINKLSGIGINIEYMYAFNGRFEDSAVVIIRVNDKERFIEIAKEVGIELLDAKEAYAML